MPHYDAEDAIWAQVLQLADACQGESNSFTVVEPFREIDPARPLYVLIHPGDTVQTRSDVAGQPNAQAILEYSAGRQEMMADDVERLKKAGWDLAVLHRFSSIYSFGTSNTLDWFEDAVDEVHERGAVLFGDRLEEAAAWLLTEARAAERLAVLLSGAWSSADWGCVAFVGSLLELAGARVHLAPSACISPDGTGDEWKPVAKPLGAEQLAELGTPRGQGPKA